MDQDPCLAGRFALEEHEQQYLSETNAGPSFALICYLNMLQTKPGPELFGSNSLVHNIWQSKLFVVQPLLENAELQNFWSSGYLKKNESWIIKSCWHEVVLICRV